MELYVTMTYSNDALLYAIGHDTFLLFTESVSFVKRTDMTQRSYEVYIKLVLSKLVTVEIDRNSYSV